MDIPGDQTELTRLTKAGGPLTKQLHLTPDGKLANDSTQCRMARGQLERIRLEDWRSFGPLIETTAPNVAYALGRLIDGLPDKARLVTKGDPEAGQPGVVARTQSNFLYRPGAPAFVLIDYDTKGMPDAVRARIETLGGFTGALAAVCPGVSGAGYIERRSTSAGAHNAATGETYPSDGRHLYLLVKDGADAKRFLYALHDRAWLCGLGWHLVGRAGQLLERSIIDRMVHAPERLVFEAQPDLEPPLEQRPRKATVHDGAPLDTLACPNLTTRELSELERLKAVATNALRREAEAAEAAFVAEQGAKAVARGVDREKARATARAWSKGVLRPGAMLDFDDQEIGTRAVADVLSDPQRFDGETLADPIEGADYGRNCAIVQSRPDGSVQIYSFAHGGAFYRLVHDCASIEAAILAAPKEEATKTLFRLIGRADVDADDRKRLCKLAGARSGGGTRVAEKMVAEALAEQRKATARERRDRNRASSTKPRLPKPAADAEAQPIMETWDDILAHAAVPEPPMRDVEQWPVVVQQREVAGLHELSGQRRQRRRGRRTCLPSPKTFLITKHDTYTLEIELSRYVTFVEETRDGERNVGAPFHLLMHWLKYHQSNLPLVRAVVTMPLALAGRRGEK